MSLYIYFDLSTNEFIVILKIVNLFVCLYVYIHILGSLAQKAVAQLVSLKAQ